MTFSVFTKKLLFIVTLAITLPILKTGPVFLYSREKVKLLFAPLPGKEIVYSLGSLIDVEGRGLLGQDLSMNVGAYGRVKLFSRPAEAERIRMDLSTPGIEVNVRLPEKLVSRSLGTIAGHALQVYFTSSGRVQEVVNPEVLEPRSFFNISIPQVLRDFLPTFPEQAVAIGSNWTEYKNLNFPFQGLSLEVKLKIDCLLEEIVSGNEGRKAIISAVYTVTLSGSQDIADSMGVFAGQGSGNGTIQFLIDQGYFSEYRVNFRADASFLLKKEEKTLAEFPFSFSVNNEINLLQD